MTTEEFYAQALTACLPIAVYVTSFDPTTREKRVASLAYEYAALLTETFISKRETFET
jgi:hypothetical protein